MDIHLNPKIGPDWMNRGKQKTVETPGNNVKRYLCGALDANTGLLTWVKGEKKNSLLFIAMLLLEALRLIQEDTPVPLSSISRTLRGDLEKVMGKAPEKERAGFGKPLVVTRFSALNVIQRSTHAPTYMAHLPHLPLWRLACVKTRQELLTKRRTIIYTVACKSFFLLANPAETFVAILPPMFLGCCRARGLDNVPSRGKGMLKKMVPSKKALLGWEMGGGLGHVHCLVRMAEGLEAQGFEPVMVLKQPDLLARHARWPVVQAPVFVECVPTGFVATTFADVLAVSGYANCDSLLPLVDRWRAILRQVRPSVVVADYSPTLCLAARGEFPVVATGTGFALPPSQNGLFPRMSEHGRSPVSQVQIFATIQESQRRRGRSPLKSLASLLETDARFVTTLPEVDTYAGLRTTPAVGPVDPLPAPSHSMKKAFFAYLSMEMPGCEAVLEALAQAGFPGRAFVRGADAALRERMAPLGLEVCERPLSPEQIVAESAVIVHHGSGIADLALAAGRAQFVFPAHLEHFLTARRLCELGVAHLLSGTYPASDVTEGLRQLMEDTKFSRRAAAVAADVYSRGPWDALGKIVSSCEKLSERSIGMPIGKSIGSPIGSSVG